MVRKKQDWGDWSDEEWAVLWTELLDTARQYCVRVSGDESIGGMVAFNAYVQVCAEVENALRDDRIAFLGRGQFFVYVRQRLVWRSNTELGQVMQLGPCISLDAPVAPDRDDCLHDVIGDPRAMSPEQLLLARENDAPETDEEDAAPAPARMTNRDDPLGRRQTLRLLLQRCATGNPALLELVKALDVIADAGGFPTGAERSKAVMGMLGISRNVLDTRMRRLRQLLGSDGAAPQASRRPPAAWLVAVAGTTDMAPRLVRGSSWFATHASGPASPLAA